jgi:carbon-monoxide dehydrogenase small subunit
MRRSRRVELRLNGEPLALERDNNVVLVDVLREMRMTGTKVSCDQGVCGACTVLVDGTPVASCMTPLFMLDGTRIETIEGLTASGGGLHPVQQAFVDESALQCGYCTPGMVMLVKAMFDADPDPDAETIRRWLASNICRCTGYTVIFRAVERARRLINEHNARPVS